MSTEIFVVFKVAERYSWDDGLTGSSTANGKWRLESAQWYLWNGKTIYVMKGNNQICWTIFISVY